MKNPAEIPPADRSHQATVDLMAGLFHAILKDECVSPEIRVWFARLQWPVIRLATIEPTRFQDESHPARELLAQLSRCALQLDTPPLPSAALAQEIKRLVMLIERFPEADCLVFEWVCAEFDWFLKDFQNSGVPGVRLPNTPQDPPAAVKTDYKKNLRSLLDASPVQAQTRDFLDVVWVQVVSLHVALHGHDDPRTLAAQQIAIDLIHLHTALLRQQERQRAMRKVPILVLKLRQGMSKMGLSEEVQDEHIQKIGHNLSDAFMREHPNTPVDALQIERRAVPRPNVRVDAPPTSDAAAQLPQADCPPVWPEITTGLCPQAAWASQASTKRLNRSWHRTQTTP